ncbi:hypothetical protein [Pseudonocardia sp. ICBG162]|uniref:hypothetical protein n=1 Tax=Pseudonocardia sp. ICBG162 TaxID=2846761 RepID=UPI001CF68558|nr:hypothetical protein [Pseudonocardia sp. ICBG162]
MLSWEADVEAHALREQGWTVSAIARHLGDDRKIIRAYLSGARVPERRVRREPTLTDPFLEYCRLRLGSAGGGALRSGVHQGGVRPGPGQGRGVEV